jgi:hypothetical protein
VTLASLASQVGAFFFNCVTRPVLEVNIKIGHLFKLCNIKHVFSK